MMFIAVFLDSSFEAILVVAVKAHEHRRFSALVLQMSLDILLGAVTSITIISRASINSFLFKRIEQFINFKLQAFVFGDQVRLHVVLHRGMVLAVPALVPRWLIAVVLCVNVERFCRQVFSSAVRIWTAHSR